MDATPLQIMLNPSGDCLAHCLYCFGPNMGPVMNESTLAAALDWIETIRRPAQPLALTLHGGEPLLAGLGWYEHALMQIRKRLGPQLRLSLQSNLWLLDDAFCEVFREYNVSLGTSLDGPSDINDAQRGAGYFSQTMRGIETARRHGIDVGVICTFTGASALRWQDVFNFFLAERLSFSIHGVISTLGHEISKVFALTADAFANLLIDMFDCYLEHVARIRIPTFDQMMRGMTSNCSICIFSPCLGRYLSISSNGGIYPCNRFTPHFTWQLGMVQQRPTIKELSQTPPWQSLLKRQSEVKHDCGDCSYFANCNGGCVYHSLAAGTDRRDAFCNAYRRIFAHITEKALNKIFSEENIAAVINEGINDKRGFLRKGQLLQIMRGGAHPTSIVSRAQEIAAAIALAASASPIKAFEKLNCIGLITNPECARASLQRLWVRLQQFHQRRSEAYIHITYACNLTCSHCYAAGNSARSAEHMSITQTRELLQSLIAASFHRIKITGGEPLVHPNWKELQDILTSLQSNILPSQLVLRTNLSVPLSASALHALTKCFDHIIVSVDGDQAFHDTRRGLGSYAKTIANLRILAQISKTTRITLSATLSTEQVRGLPGRSVRELASELGFTVRFRPVLPLGRAAGWSLRREVDSSVSSSAEMVNNFAARNSCSLGNNLHIEADGTCYPCFALTGATHNLGNVFKDGLDSVLYRNMRYSQYTVNTNQQCRQCVWRYLCGGNCRIWSSNEDPDSPPQDCTALQKHAAVILHSALDILDVNLERWQSIGLPDVQNVYLDLEGNLNS